MGSRTNIEMDQQQEYKPVIIKEPPKIGKSIPELEKERNTMERELTSNIMLFNQRVTKHTDDLERGIMKEITGLQTELQKEEKRRTENDQMLLSQVNEFLINL